MLIKLENGFITKDGKFIIPKSGYIETNDKKLIKEIEKYKDKKNKGKGKGKDKPEDKPKEYKDKKDININNDEDVFDETLNNIEGI
jgi:hypothetical protein